MFTQSFLGYTFPSSNNPVVTHKDTTTLVRIMFWRIKQESSQYLKHVQRGKGLEEGSGITKMDLTPLKLCLELAFRRKSY